MEPKKKTSKKEYTPAPRNSDGKYSKETESKRLIDEHKKTSPKKVIAKPVDSKKINDKKTGSSDKKNPHTPSSKERIY